MQSFSLLCKKNLLITIRGHIMVWSVIYVGDVGNMVLAMCGSFVMILMWCWQCVLVW